MGGFLEVGTTNRILVPIHERSWRTWADRRRLPSYGGKAILDAGGQPGFAEHLVCQELISSGAEWAYWSDNFRRRYSTTFGSYLQIQDLPPSVRSVVMELIRMNGGRRGGIWDVIGYHSDGTVVLREAKRKGRDALGPKQHRFADLLHDSTIDVDLAIVEWDLAAE